MDARVEQAILQITASFREELSLSALANVVGLSAFHFHRLFKTETGETPASYLSRIRLEHAAHLIVVLPDAPLVQIALDSGFSSAATFARAFRQQYGVSASQYRLTRALAIDPTLAPVNLQLCQLPDRQLRVQRCPLDEVALTAGYRSLITKQRGRASVALGIFVDAPFHQSRASCRHYLALATDTSASHASGLLLPGGLYAQFHVSGDLDELSAAILAFKETHLDPSPYAIGSTLAFEQVSLPASPDEFDYPHSQRKVFIKVRRKNEPVI